jgi:hypothetical protein
MLDESISTVSNRHADENQIDIDFDRWAHPAFLVGMAD